MDNYWIIWLLFALVGGIFIWYASQKTPRHNKPKTKEVKPEEPSPPLNDWCSPMPPPPPPSPEDLMWNCNRPGGPPCHPEHPGIPKPCNPGVSVPMVPNPAEGDLSYEQRLKI